MYSEKHDYIAEGGCPMSASPMGQKVAVIVLRERGFKLSYAQLSALAPLIGYIRRENGAGAGSGMAYRTHSRLELRQGAQSLASIAQLNNPVLFDWNSDGLIFEGWVLERDPVHEQLQQVVQMWWVRNLEALSEKPEIRPFKLRLGQRPA